jgi:hypothetical protein
MNKFKYPIDWRHLAAVVVFGVQVQGFGIIDAAIHASGVFMVLTLLMWVGLMVGAALSWLERKAGFHDGSR